MYWSKRLGFSRDAGLSQAGGEYGKAKLFRGRADVLPARNAAL
jgi:hypothetical protein